MLNLGLMFFNVIENDQSCLFISYVRQCLTQNAASVYFLLALFIFLWGRGYYQLHFAERKALKNSQKQCPFLVTPFQWAGLQIQKNKLKCGYKNAVQAGFTNNIILDFEAEQEIEKKKKNWIELNWKIKRPVFQTLMGGFSAHFIKPNSEFTFQLSVISLSQLWLFPSSNFIWMWKAIRRSGEDLPPHCFLGCPRSGGLAFLTCLRHWRSSEARGSRTKDV